MNAYVNLHYSFLLISLLVIHLFKKCNDFDLFLAFLVLFNYLLLLFFFAILLTNRAIYITMSKPESKQSTKIAENLKFGIQSKVFSFILYVCNVKSTQHY